MSQFVYALITYIQISINKTDLYLKVYLNCVFKIWLRKPYACIGTFKNIC
jgi:hypothetical protein